MGGAVHRCTICGARDAWSDDWEWYGSWKDLEAGNPIIKTCRKTCRTQLDSVTPSSVLAKLSADPDYTLFSSPSPVSKGGEEE